MSESHNIWTSKKAHLKETNRPYGNYFNDIYNARPRSILDHEFGSYGSRRNLVKYPEFLDCTGDSILVSDRDNDRIQIFSCIGEETAYNPYGYQGSNRNGLDTPTGITSTPIEGARVVVCDNGNKRVVFLQPKEDKNSNKYLNEILEFGPGIFDNPMGCAYDHRRRLIYVVDAGHQRVTMHDMLTGRCVGQLRPHPSLLFRRPIEVAVNSSGRIFVTDAYHHVVTAYSPDGGFLMALGGYGSSRQNARHSGALVEPWGVCIDRTHNVIVGDEGNNRVQSYDERTGEFLRTVVDDVYRPKAVAVNSHEDLVVSTHETQNFIKIVKYK